MMEPVTNLLRHVAETDLPQLHAELSALEAREKRTGERQLGNLWKDTTVERIAGLRRHIQTLDMLVAALDASRTGVNAGAQGQLMTRDDWYCGSTAA